jgi:hypothetical protein
MLAGSLKRIWTIAISMVLVTSLSTLADVQSSSRCRPIEPIADQINLFDSPTSPVPVRQIEKGKLGKRICSFEEKNSRYRIQLQLSVAWVEVAQFHRVIVPPTKQASERASGKPAEELTERSPRYDPGFFTSYRHSYHSYSRERERERRRETVRAAQDAGHTIEKAAHDTGSTIEKAAQAGQAQCCFANPPCCQSEPGGNTCKPVHGCGPRIGDPLGSGRPLRGQSHASDISNASNQYVSVLYATNRVIDHNDPSPIPLTSITIGAVRH